MKRTLFAFFAAALVATAANAAPLSGTANKIVDGDTFWLCQGDACRTIRVCGINAPEKGEAGYGASTAALAVLVKDATVNCVPVGRGTPCDGRSKPTSHARIIAQCFVNGTDVAETLVRQGTACDWVKFSGGAYSQNGLGSACPVADEEASIEDTTIDRMEAFERNLRKLNLDPAKANELVREGKRAFLKNYCLRSQLRDH